MNAKSLILIGAALILFSLFVPVATVSAGFLSRSMNGYESDLVLAGGTGFFLLLVGLTGKPEAGKIFSAFGIVLALATFAIVAWVALNLTTVSVTADASVSTGLAPMMAFVGGLLALVGSATRAPATPPTPIV